MSTSGKPLVSAEAHARMESGAGGTGTAADVADEVGMVRHWSTFATARERMRNSLKSEERVGEWTAHDRTGHDMT